MTKELFRPNLRRRVIERLQDGPPLLLTGPRGAGKTTLLLSVCNALARDGWSPIYLDLMAAASSPERFVGAAIRALPNEVVAHRLADTVEIQRLAGSGRSTASQAVDALLSLWGAIDEVDGRPVALILDDATEIRSLAYFSGLREVHKPMAAALGARRRGTLLATSFPTLARRFWPGLDTTEAQPLSGDDLEPVLRRAGVSVDADALARASFGWPRYLCILLDRLSRGDGLVESWADEMSPGGRLELACRHTYECMLLRSRGYGMSKAVLSAVAHEEGLNLTALVARLGRTPGAIRDYLQWLLGVDALRMSKKRYYYVDGLVRWWVRLHGRGTPATDEEILAAAHLAVGEGTEDGDGRGPAREEEPVSSARAPSLIEID
jgi:hypothetical protein